jgi:hypothetical protein
MWSNIKEAFSILSWLDLAALAFIAYEVHARGWPYVKGKLQSAASAFKTDVSDLELRVKSIETLLLQAKIAIPAPTEPIVPVTGPVPKA